MGESDGKAAAVTSNGTVGFAVSPLITLDGHSHDKEAESEDPRDTITEEARKLVRKHTVSHGACQETRQAGGSRSGFTTPTEEQDFIEDYQPPPEQYRGGILSACSRTFGFERIGANHSWIPHVGKHFSVEQPTRECRICRESQVLALLHHPWGTSGE